MRQILLGEFTAMRERFRSYATPRRNARGRLVPMGRQGHRPGRAAGCARRNEPLRTPVGRSGEFMAARASFATVDRKNRPKSESCRVLPMSPSRHSWDNPVPAVERPTMHPRNKNAAGYDFAALAATSAALAKHIKTTPAGTTSIDFANPADRKSVGEG